MRDITDDNFMEVLKTDCLVLVEFWADWCGPCKQMVPVLESLDQEVSWVNVVKANIDENAELAKRYDISSVPTFLLFKNGKVVEYHVGALPKFKILGMLNDNR
jgi:thioredoxin 1